MPRTSPLFAIVAITVAIQLAGANAAQVRVIDGDTIAIGEETVRIENLDAPEMPGRARCDGEAELALKARDRMIELVGAGTVTLRRNVERPKDYYGRTLAVVLVNGQDVAEPMIAEGLARPWRGRSSDWC